MKYLPNNFHQNMFQLIHKLASTDAESITIKTGEATIVFKLEDGVVSGRIYKNESLQQVWMHGKNSIKELWAAFDALGVCLFELVKRLSMKLWKRSNGPLLIDLKPEPKE